jgi:hypothetical protein
MSRRLEERDAQALMNIRTNLIKSYQRVIDADHSTRQVAQCKQSDVDTIIMDTIKSLEEVLTVAADIQFKRR